ncbi:SELM protein, partial [Ardeotis kori]|nr:SELM protein [Ardeotis kori]
PRGPAKCCLLLNAPPSHNLEMKHLPGADPELVLLSHRYEELERIPLSDMTREEINQLVQELGFYRKETPDAPVPEEFQFAPARPLPTLPPRQAPAADGKTPPEHEEGEHPDL